MYDATFIKKCSLSNLCGRQNLKGTEEGRYYFFYSLFYKGKEDKLRGYRTGWRSPKVGVGLKSGVRVGAEVGLFAASVSVGKGYDKVGRIHLKRKVGSIREVGVGIIP